MTQLGKKIAFLGAGRMATALAQGLIQAGLSKPHDLRASDPVRLAREQFAAATGATVSQDNAACAEGSDVVVLAVKPQHVAETLRGLKGRLTGEQLLMSVAAGVPLATLAAHAGEGPRLVRVMPNTPCLVGYGASAFALGRGATRADAELIARLLGSVGLARELDERLLDAVTGLSGSGPAFVYLVIEALSDGGVAMGLPRDVALELAAQTVRGAAEMVLVEKEHPGVLKDRVASPGGTTIAGLRALEDGRVRAALMAAVEAATRRSAELAKAL